MIVLRFFRGLAALLVVLAALGLAAALIDYIVDFRPDDDWPSPFGEESPDGQLEPVSKTDYLWQAGLVIFGALMIGAALHWTIVHLEVRRARRQDDAVIDYDARGRAYERQRLDSDD